jgi:hypothetical protein
LILSYLDLNFRVKDANMQVWANKKLIHELVPRDEHCPKLIVIEAANFAFD